MIDHDAARELAAAQLDFDLSSADQDRLLAHLVECAPCRAFVEALEADHRAITGIASQDAPAELRDRILASVAAPAPDAPDVTDVPEAAVEPAPSSAEPQRPTPIRSLVPVRYRWPLVTAAAAAIIVALVAGGLVWRPTEGPNVALGSPSGPTGSEAVPSSPEPAPSIEPGSRLAASPWNQVADLTANEAPGGVVGLASGFRLTSLDGTPAAELAKRLTVEPEMAFAAAAGTDPKTVEITPAEPLRPGAVYRFSLKTAAGQEVGTWAFQAHQPLRVVGALPNDTATDVPLDTGIEITFDQDGVVDAESHVAISPNVDGRFEQHSRVLAFVPEQPLEPATIYTVTVSPGVEVGGTGERLEVEFRFQFETSATGEAPRETTFRFSEDLFETATKDRPIIALWAFQDSDEEDDPVPPPPKSVPLEIYEIDGLDAAMTIYRQLRAIPRWSRQTSTNLVPTAGLSRVLALEARLRASEGVLWTELPERLPAGWYLVHLASPTRPIQAMLQVTDIASYLVVSETKTLLWTNNLATGRALRGAVATTADGDLGTTGADGTLFTTTPASVMPAPSGTCPRPCVALIAIHAGDRAAFVPASEPSDPEGKGGGYSDRVDESIGFWHAFDTDRTMFRRTDTVNTWGVVRDRDTGDVPAVVKISLSAMDSDTGDAGPALIAHEVHPNKVGAFSDSIAFEDLPEGDYQLDLRVGAKLVATTGIQVDRILKPAYRLEVTTGRRVYVAGDQVRITANAAFYEGSPVPGIRLRLDGMVSGGFTTDESGVATRRTVARMSGSAEEGEGDGSAEIQSIGLTPATAEEGEISGTSREIVIFPSHWVISGTATVREGRVRANGRLAELDRDRVEREVNSGEDPWSLDPAGKALAGRTVALTFFVSTTTRTKSGTRYDFIEKKVVPTYEYRSSERIAQVIRVTTDSKGRFSASIAAASGEGHSYRVRVTKTDTDGHVARWVAWAAEQGIYEDQAYAALTLTSDPTISGASFGVGDRIDVTMADPTAAGEGAQDRYLFYTAQRGLRDVTVQDSARYRSTFDGSAAPTLQIASVRFNGSRYSTTTTFGAGFEVAERGLTVVITADAARYAPGDDVQLQVTTRDRAGDPVAATVILRAVDEKLFTLGGATAADPLNEIYMGVESGIRVTYRSHRSPRAETDGGGGDTTGGGGDDRIDFRDQILFRSVDTGSDGKASVTMNLSDDLTSWHVSGSAIGAGLTAGEGSLLIPVGLPFFADATIAPEYLVSDKPEIGLRAFGTALTATSDVTFAVDSDSLGLHVAGLDADAFETVTVALPKLTLGRHAVTITARTGSGSTAREDRLTRTFTVVGSRLERVTTAYEAISGVSHVKGGDGLTEVTVSDIGVGRYAPLILDLTGVDSVRLERVLASAIAASLAQETFHVDDAMGASDFDGARYQTSDGGLALVPYGGSDLEASALAALIAPDRFNVGGLRAYLAARASDDKETRERRNFALAGLAGLGASVLPEIRAAAADPALTVRERLLLGIGAAALGDAALAHSIAASLIETYGEAATGDQARLRVGSDAGDVTQATALMALLAAANGDPLGPLFWNYVAANPDKDATYALHAVGFVDRILAHSAPTAASFAYATGGDRKVVELEAGEAFHVTILPSQLASFTVEPVSGSIAVTTSWREAVDPESFKKDPDIKVSRSVTPSGVAKSSDLVKVELVVDFGPLQPEGCVMVTDFVPSGLVAVGTLRGWVHEEEENEMLPANATRPFAQTGQRVYFCAEPTPDGRRVTLRYYARVISPGRYTWETAIAQSPFRPEGAALTGATVIRID